MTTRHDMAARRGMTPEEWFRHNYYCQPRERVLVEGLLPYQRSFLHRLHTKKTLRLKP